MAKAILYNDLWDFYDHDSAETRCFYLPIEYEELEPYFVDYEPVVHGHWIEEEDCTAVTDIPWSMCSACGSYSLKLPYCAFCGAKMDEEVYNS